jgi:hypothetical protein
MLLKSITYLWNKIHFPEETQPILIFGQCPIHKKADILEAITNRGGKYRYFLIPPGCTGYLQPLDVVINKPFKDRMRQKFKTWVGKNSLNGNNITRQGNIKAPSNDEFIGWSLETIDEIDSFTIKKSFKTCGNINNYTLGKKVSS